VITVDLNRLGFSPVKSSDCGEWRVLDIGCGTGRHIGALCRYDHIVMAGVDKHVKELIAAQSRIKKVDKMGFRGANALLLSAADAARLPFKTHCFDVVICSEVLEHIPDHHAVMRELERVLKQEGTLAVSVPRYFPERICWMLSKNYHITEGGHVRIYKKNQLAALLRIAGFKLQTWHYAHSLHTPYWWLKCLVGPARTDNFAVNLYHRFLIYDMMTKPCFTKRLEKLLDPFIGKSLVIYLKKI